MSRNVHHRTREKFPAPNMMICQRCSTEFDVNRWFTEIDFLLLPAPAGPRCNGKLRLKASERGYTVCISVSVPPASYRSST